MKKLVLFLMAVFVCTQFNISVFSQSEEHLEIHPRTSVKKVNISSSNSKITLLELKNMDILEAFKLLSKKSGVNIVASNSVKGRISIFLRNVEAWDVLRMIFEANNLAYEEKGILLR